MSCQKLAKVNLLSPPSYNLNSKEDVKEFIKDHYINHKGQIIGKATQVELEDTILHSPSYIFETFSLSYYEGENTYIGSHHIEIVDGYPKGKYQVCHGGDTLKSISYKDGNYSGFLEVFHIDGNRLYSSKFRKGSGYWKDFYPEEGVIKEDGEVKDNYKHGKWTYYSKTGKIDSVKTYRFQDSVDIRYPYCLFNKTEPCY